MTKGTSNIKGVRNEMENWDLIAAAVLLPCSGDKPSLLTRPAIWIMDQNITSAISMLNRDLCQLIKLYKRIKKELLNHFVKKQA